MSEALSKAEIDAYWRAANYLSVGQIYLLRRTMPELRIRCVNVVDLMTLQPSEEHPHGLSSNDFDAIFTTEKTDHFRLPRLSLADPPLDVPAN